MHDDIHRDETNWTRRAAGWLPTGFGFGLLLGWGLPSYVVGQQAGNLTCAPPTFQMTRTVAGEAGAVPRFQYRLKGQLETPTPGYRFDLIADHAGVGGNPFTYRFRLHLARPRGAAPTVIATLNIDAAVLLPTGDAQRVVIDIDKEFGWGLDVITCVVPYE